VSGYGPGTAVPTPYLILVAGSIFVALDVALCRPAKWVNLKPRATVSPGHGLCVRASLAVGRPRGVPIRAAYSDPPRISWRPRYQG
jgi:hypothetical protein